MKIFYDPNANREIIDVSDSKTISDIITEFGVSESTISSILVNDEYYKIENDSIVISKTADTNNTWDAIRNKRNALLAECDWTQLADAPLTTEQNSAWVIYRQNLRNIPQTYATPSDVAWPIKPE